MRHLRHLRGFWKNLDSARAAIWGVLIGFIILGGAVVYGFQKIEDTRINSAKAGCESGIELRQLVREKLVEAPLEVGESLIDVFSARNRSLRPEVVDEFRRIERERLERIASEIPTRRWDADSKTCVDVELR